MGARRDQDAVCLPIWQGLHNGMRLVLSSGPDHQAQVGDPADLSRLLVRWSTVRLVSWPISAGKDVSWFLVRSSRVRLVSWPISAGNSVRWLLSRTSSARLVSWPIS